MASAGDLPLVVVRAVHFAAAILLFGQFAFALFVAPGRRVPPRFRSIAAWSLAGFFVSALAWLGLEAISMSGMPARQALSAATFGTVLTQTQFGRMWLARAIVGVALIAALAPRGRAGPVLGLAGSGFLLLGLAAMGHGGSGRGFAGLVHFGCDAVHLLAAGAWLGALVPLVCVLLASTRSADEAALGFAAQATRRFSTLGLVSMAVILLSGIGNACYLLASVGELFGSQYGHWLLAKIVLFAIILAVAALNRQRLTPRLAAGSASRSALRSLGRNALAECLLGFAIVLIVAKLGITMPASHHMG